MKIRENVPIAKLTTMRLGGPARYVIDIESAEDLPEAYAFAAEKDLPVYVLGGGSNIVGRDGGFDGVILVNHLLGMGEVAPEKDGKIELWAASGEALDDFVRYSTKYGWSGMECLSAIPGTVGAAPVQNVGAYGQDIAGVLKSVEAYNIKTKQFVTLPASKLDLGYRRSIFNTGELVGRYFITKITVTLEKKELKPPFYNSLQKYLDDHEIDEYTPENLRKAVHAVRTKLPNPEFIASSGSFFKNIYLNEEDSKKAIDKGIPVWEGGKIPSGWLIENAGLKGQLIHGMRVWETASLVLVNESAKSYKDLDAARQEIIKTIQDKYGLTLEQEPMELGDE